MNKPNPISQNNMARKFGTKQQIINKIIHEDLGMITRKNGRCMISNQNISKIGKLIVASYTKIIWRLTEGNTLLHLMKRGWISIIALVKGESAMLKEVK